MRSVQDPQRSFGQIDIAQIELDPQSRDDIPAILKGLQQIYTTPKLCEEVFDILQQVIPKRRGDGLSEQEREQSASSNHGRPGMEQWTILVLGVLRLGLNTDYDRIHELANNHSTLRQMLGHSLWFDDKHYALQTIKDNLMLFTPEILDQINQAVVKAGHALIEGSCGCKAQPKSLRGRCDSFVVETHVHFPTDINLLYDAVRKAIEESADLAEQYELPGWRQYKHSIKQFKRQYRIIQKLKTSKSQDKVKKQQREQEIELAHIRYIDRAMTWIEKTEETLKQAQQCKCLAFETQLLAQYQAYAHLLMDQIHRRVILGEKIPHAEKIFSIFQPHTEWINKGKAGVPVELGLRVCIMEDQHQFILHHQVMEQLTDDKVAVDMVVESKKRFPELVLASFDKGFHSQQNQKDLKEHLEHVILPKKGRLNEAEKAHQSSEVFKRNRQQHSAVESAINGLEQGGLDICQDHGIEGFKRYVGLAVLSRNIKRLGTLVRQQEREEEKRKRGPYKKAA
jgi:hypothetical protein